MQKETRELILNKIKEVQNKIDLNNQVTATNPEFLEFNILENELLKTNINLMKKALIEDDINIVFNFTDQL